MPLQTLVLVGLMGTGKSTVGRRLAQKLDLPFVDADEEIERAAALSIAEIFARYGEESFRDGERRVIRRLLEAPPHVLATGGGAFMNAQTRQLLQEKAITIWLNAPLDVLVERTARRNHRPLLQTADPRETLAKLAAIRNPLYAQAHIHIASGRGPHEQTVKSILMKLRKYTPRNQDKK